MEEERGDTVETAKHFLLVCVWFVSVFVCEEERKDGGREASGLPSLCVFVIYDR